MYLKHSEHYNNMLVYGDCECKAGLTIGELVRALERKKLLKLLSEYPDLRLSKKLDELSAGVPY